MEGKLKNAKKKEVRSSSVRQKLRDLMVASPPGKRRVSDDGGDTGVVVDSGGGGGGGVRGGMRPLTATLRQRLLRRSWRPVLLAIPEISPS